jgi:G3E family GTPase
MRVNLLFGFLGSGKTTLARRLLKEGGVGRKMAVIVNEFGDIGIDGEILEGADIDMVELTSGCLCCTLKGPLINAIEELNAKKDIDITIIEATGIAEPKEMMEIFSDDKFRGCYEVGPMITVVDVPKFTQLLEMLGPFYEAQIRNADVLILMIWTPCAQQSW